MDHVVLTLNLLDQDLEQNRALRLVGQHHHHELVEDRIYHQLSSAPSSSSSTPTSSATSTPAPAVNKKNNLDAFINWNRANANQNQPLRRQQKQHQHDYYDYDLHQTTSDSSVPSYAQQYYTPIGNTSVSSFATAMGQAKIKEDQNDRKNLTGDHSIDFPALLGGPAPVHIVPQASKTPKTGGKNQQPQQKGSKQAKNAPVVIPNAWGVVTSTAPAPAAKSKPTTQNSNANNNNNKVSSNNKNNDANNKNNNKNNTGLAASTTAPPAAQKVSKAVHAALVKSYSEELSKILAVELPAIDSHIKTLMSTPGNRGKKNELIQNYLFGASFTFEGQGTPSTTQTPFQQIISTLSKHDPSELFPGFQTLEVLQHIFHTTLKSVLLDTHRKSISSTLAQIAILAQSLCSDTNAEPSIFTFHTFGQILELSPHSTELSAMAQSFQSLYDRTVKKSITQLPTLQSYPELSHHNVAENAKKTQELVGILTDTNSANMNKRLLAFITHNMDLPKRICLYVYLHHYIVKVLFAPTILERIIYDHLRVVDAQQ